MACVEEKPPTQIGNVKYSKKKGSGAKAPMPEKGFGAFIARGMEHFPRRTLLHQPSLFKIQDLIRQALRLGGRVSGKNQGALCSLHIFPERLFNQIHTAHISG
jgi:hypothetical protein